MTKIKKKQHWLKQLITNAKRREKYHLQKYGDLKKLDAKDEKMQKKMDDISMDEEMENCK